jgi:uncharacterized protein
LVKVFNYFLTGEKRIIVNCLQFNAKRFSWGHTKRYNDFPTYFRNLFSERVQKVSVDAGFTCPTATVQKAVEVALIATTKRLNPLTAISKIRLVTRYSRAFRFFEKKYKSMRFLAYFQAYTSTWAPLENLIPLYEEALQHPKIVGLVISTRPDAVNEELLDYLADLSKKVYVMVEFGLESHLDTSLEKMNRGHTFAESVWALEQTALRGNHNCAHLFWDYRVKTRNDWLEQAG